MINLPQLPKTPPSDDFILSTHKHVSTMFSPRNSEYQILRKVFDGDFMGASQVKALGDSQFQERVKLIYNICNATVRRYMDQLSAPPRIEAVPRGWEPKDLEIADKQTKFLEYVYEANGFDKLLMQAGFYQSLLDNAVWHVRPNPDGVCKIKLELGVPDFYYPIVQSDDWNDVRGVIYAFRKFDAGAWQQKPLRAPIDGELAQAGSDVVVEWWDAKYCIRFEGGKKVGTIQHDLGIIPWHKADNIPIPHRFRGQGDVDQAIGLNEYLNMLMSDMADMINYAANPIAVVRGTKVGGVNLPFAPRAVWELERDAQVGFLQWTGAPPSVEAQLIRSIQAIEDTTGVSSPAFGREIPSGTSGSAVRSLMAGFNTRLGTKQTLMGGALVRANTSICAMAERLFPNWEIPVIGELQTDEDPEGTAALAQLDAEADAPKRKPRKKGSKVQYVVKPKEFDGWYKTRMIFPPTDPTASYFQEMDKFAKGIQSKETTMRNMGITNIYDEQERIRTERLEEAEHANNMGLAQQGQFVSPGQQEAKQQADSQGLAQAMQQFAAARGALPNGAQQRADKRKTEATFLKPHGQGLLEGPGGTTSPAGAGDTPGTEGDVNISDVMLALKRATNLSGRGAVVGDLAKKGSAGRFTIALENPQDVNAIKMALGPLASKADFTVADFKKPLPEDSVSFSDPSKAGARKPSGDGPPPRDAIGITNPLEKSEFTRESKKKSIQRSGIVDPQGLDENGFPLA